MNLYATFGSGQPFANHYIKYTFETDYDFAAASIRVREFMQANFGGRYCSIYSEEKWSKSDNLCAHYKQLLEVDFDCWGDAAVYQTFNGGRLA